MRKKKEAENSKSDPSQIINDYEKDQKEIETVRHALTLFEDFQAKKKVQLQEKIKKV